MNRNSLSNASGSLGHTSNLGSLKQECDSLMHPSSSNLTPYPSYQLPIYNRMPFDHPPRKRPHRNQYTTNEQERGSVLRDGSKGSTESASPISKTYRYVYNNSH